jgi:hypothetical protein
MYELSIGLINGGPLSSSQACGMTHMRITNHKEEIMREKNRVTIGLIAMMAVTGIVNVSSGFASDVGEVAGTKRIGHGGSTYQLQSDRVGPCQMKADVVERIGAGGSRYSSSQNEGCQVAGDEQKKVNVIERIGAGGSTYSPSRPVS